MIQHLGPTSEIVNLPFPLFKEEISKTAMPHRNAHHPLYLLMSSNLQRQEVVNVGMIIMIQQSGTIRIVNPQLLCFILKISKNHKLHLNSHLPLYVFI